MNERIKNTLKRLPRFAVVAGAAALLAGCRGERPQQIIRVEATPHATEDTRLKVKIGEVQMVQDGTEVKVVTREPETASKVETVIDNECETETKLKVPAKSVVNVYRVGNLQCVVSPEVTARIIALQS